MKNLQLKKVNYYLICKSTNLKKISLIRNEIINFLIKKKLFLLECKSCLHRIFSYIPSDSQLKKAYANGDPIIVPDIIKNNLKKNLINIIFTKLHI